MLEEGETKLAIRMISEILCALVVENQRLSDVILSAILKQVFDKEYKEYRKYLIVLKKILLVNDSLRIQRVIMIFFLAIFLLIDKHWNE